MADFNVDIPQAQTQVTPVAPVQNNNAAQAVNAVGGLLGGLGAAVLNSAKYAEQVKQTKYKAHALGELQQNIERVQDLQSQGVMSQDQALRRIRLTTVASLANHPLLQDDINKLVGTLTGTALQEDISKGTQAEQDAHTNQQKFIQQAQAAGYGKPSDPPEVQTQMANAYQGVQLAASQLKQQSDVIAYEKAQVELGNAKLSGIAARQGIANNAVTAQRNQIGLDRDKHNLAFTQGISKLVSSYDPVFNKNMNDIRSNTQLTPEEKVQAYQSELNKIQSSATAIAIGADSGGAASSITDIYKNRAQIYIDEASGKLHKDIADTQLANTTTAAQMAFAKSDPQAFALTATSKLLPAGMSTFQQVISNAVVKMAQSHGSLPDAEGHYTKVPATVVTDGTTQSTKDVKQYSAMFLENLKQYNQGDITDDEHIKQLSTSANNFVKSFAIHGTTAQDATDLKAAVETIASPQFGVYASNPKSTLPKEFVDKAADVYKTSYEAELVPMFQKQFLNDSVIIGKKLATDQLGAARGNLVPNLKPDTSQIHVEFSGSRATFIPNDPTNQGSAAKAAQLNTSLAPIIGTMVRADAHLHGSTDYDTYGKQLLEQIQPPEQPSE